MRLPWTLILLALCAPPSPAAGSAPAHVRAAPAASDAATDVLLLVLGSLGGRAGFPERLPEELAALGADAVPTTLRLLDQRAFDARRSNGEVVRLELDDRHTGALRAGLRAMPLDALRDGLRRLDGDAGDVPERALAMRVLAEVLGRDGFDDLLDVLHLGGVDAPLAPALRLALEESTALLVQRHPAVAAELAGRFESLDARVRPSVPRALGLAGGRDALRALAGLLEREPELDPLVLVELGRVAEDLPRPIDGSVADAVARLLSARDPYTRLAAVQAVGRIGDVAQARRLVELLASDEPGMPAAAQRALRAITGRPLPPRPEAWARWLDAEEAWWDASGQRSIAELGSDDAAQVALAVNDLAPHTLYADRLALEVASLLRRDEPDLVRLACAALARLGSAHAGTSLVGTLEHDDVRVRQAAAAALNRIYRRELPPTADAWLEVVQ